MYMVIKQHVPRTSTASKILLLLVFVQIWIFWAATCCSLQLDTSKLENVLP